MTKKNQKLCKIVYVREPKECYQLFISLDNGETWGLNVSCEFVHCQEHPSCGNNYLHYSIVKELSNCLELGFKYIGLF